MVSTNSRDYGYKSHHSKRSPYNINRSRSRDGDKSKKEMNKKHYSSSSSSERGDNRK